MRDNQRSRVYNAERMLPEWGKRLGDGSMDTMNQYVSSITRTHWWLSRGGPRHVHIKDGRGTRWARGGYGQINLPRWARTKLVCLHELAHVLNNTGAPHGPEFAATLLALVRRFEPDLGDSLKAAYKEKRVRCKGAPKPHRGRVRRLCGECKKVLGRKVWGTKYGSVQNPYFCTKRCATTFVVSRLTQVEL